MRRWSSLLIVGSVFLLGLAAVLYVRQPKTIAPGDGVLSIPVTEHDFGDISVKRGTVSAEVPLVNIGEGDLVISFLETSCGCTSVQAINDGEAGPVFGMAAHGASPQDWRTTIKAGGKASLKIIYDPMVHAALRGPVIREIRITSNERAQPLKTIRIKVNQID